MAVRVDKYGHIIRDGNANNTVDNPATQTGAQHQNQIVEPDRPFDLSNPQNNQSANNLRGESGRLEQRVPWYGNGFLYWAVTIVLSLIIAYVAFYYSTILFIYSGGGDTLDNVLEGLSYYAPYIIAIGAVVGCIWYNAKGTKKDKDYYTGSNYALSPVCSAVGAVGTGAIIFLIGLAITFLFVILAVVFAFAIIGALIGG